MPPHALPPRLPLLVGRGILFEWRPQLTVCDKRLVVGGRGGTPVHAAAFLNQRRVILDSALASRPSELRRIVVHELFHFVWRRLSNQQRWSWEALLHSERSHGELGWSAEWRKRRLTHHDRRWRTRRWREYIAESFCDTAAWLYARAHRENTLSPRAAARRRRWFLQRIGSGPLAV